MLSLELNLNPEYSFKSAMLIPNHFKCTGWNTSDPIFLSSAQKFIIWNESNHHEKFMPPFAVICLGGQLEVYLVSVVVSSPPKWHSCESLFSPHRLPLSALIKFLLLITVKGICGQARGTWQGGECGTSTGGFHVSHLLLTELHCMSVGQFKSNCTKSCNLSRWLSAGLCW